MSQPMTGDFDCCYGEVDDRYRLARQLFLDDNEGSEDWLYAAWSTPRNQLPYLDMADSIIAAHLEEGAQS